ncbi:esterase B1-like [Bradysia coprophila]|uniref:esterase B1-like n=1 Tax=Bradysia coprophila TaxID=38358 RepID=UPI00187DBBED|nr:esterase B1-like [Bradysia coprophila]
MFSLFLLSVIVLTVIPTAFSNDKVIVQTNCGPVRGKLFETLFDKRSYYAFKGIPYAEPPVNKLRFKPPKPKQPWTDTLDAFEFGNVCSQNIYLFGERSPAGSEDCLFLNIYTPDVSAESKRTVMLFIHGGAFVEGSGNDNFYGPDFFINEDVVLVTLNYRLGVFGFMSLGTPEYSGNMGLKDQNLAINWIKNNIEQFGGDADKITVFGHSAGAASTHYHVLSSETNSLFQRAIAMSGSALNIWSRYVPSEHMLHMFMIANLAGQRLKTSKELIKFLHTADAQFFLENIDTSLSLAGGRKELELLWAPVIEGKNAKKPFIQMGAEDILNNKFNHKIDTMFGFTSAEMLFLIADEIRDPKLLEAFERTFEVQLTRNKMDTHYETEEYKKFANEIRNFYFGVDGQVSNETLAEYNDLLSDVFLVHGIDKSAKAHSKGKSFYYRFSVDATLNAFKILFKLESVFGTSHGDELCYLFRCHVFNEIYENIADDSVEMRTIRASTKLWTNFAKFGDPTPNNEPISFKPIQKNLINFVDITNEGLIPALGPHKKFVDFWTDIFSRYETHLVNSNVRDEL